MILGELALGSFATVCAAVLVRLLNFGPLFLGKVIDGGIPFARPSLPTGISDIGNPSHTRSLSAFKEYVQIQEKQEQDAGSFVFSPSCRISQTFFSMGEIRLLQLLAECLGIGLIGSFFACRLFLAPFWPTALISYSDLFAMFFSIFLLIFTAFFRVPVFSPYAMLRQPLVAMSVVIAQAWGKTIVRGFDRHLRTFYQKVYRRIRERWQVVSLPRFRTRRVPHDVRSKLYHISGDK